MNLDRFQPPNRNDERDFDREEEIELEKADMWQDQKVDREADDSLRQAVAYNEHIDTKTL